MFPSEELYLLLANDTHNSIKESDDHVEVISDFKTQENELISMNTSLGIASSDDSDSNNDNRPVYSFGESSDSVSISPSLSKCQIAIGQGCTTAQTRQRYEEEAERVTLGKCEKGKNFPLHSSD